MTPVKLAQLIACEIAKQGVETDNLGDNETLVLFAPPDDASLYLNLVEIAEAILKGSPDMSGGMACRCEERHEPPVAPDASNRPARMWRVMQRDGNYSAFNGYQWTPSDYSAITCLRCGAVWRTKGSYVNLLADINESERNLSCGHAGHPAAMAAAGRSVHPYHAGDEL